MRLDLSRSPRAAWLKNERIVQWMENLERRSVNTAAVYFRRLGYVCDMMDTTPEKLAKMDGKQATDFVFDLIRTGETQKKTGSNIFSLVKGVKSWFDFNEIYVKKRIFVQGKDDNVRYAEEVTPSKEELDKIFRAGNLRARAATSLMAFCGFRDQVLGDVQGTDGLRVNDIPDLKIKDNKIEWTQIPAMVKVRRNLSKKKFTYFTFIPGQACGFLQEYLEWRVSELGEKLTPESAIITGSPHNRSVNKKSAWHKEIGQNITTTNVGDLIRKPTRATGLDTRPYVLRRYFDVGMMMAEYNHLIIRDFRQFWMGHKGDIEHTYTVNKGLPPDVIEKMREAYRKAAEKFLVTTNKESPEDTMTQRMNHRFLRYAGYTEDQINELGDLSKLTEDQMMDFVNRKSMASLGLNDNHQKVVQMTDVKPYITQGWEFVSALPDGEAIVRLPRLNQ